MGVAITEVLTFASEVELSFPVAGAVKYAEALEEAMIYHRRAPLAITATMATNKRTICQFVLRPWKDGGDLIGPGDADVSSGVSNFSDDGDDNGCSVELLADVDVVFFQALCKAFAKAVTFSYRWARPLARALNTTCSTERGRPGTLSHSEGGWANTCWVPTWMEEPVKGHWPHNHW